MKKMLVILGPTSTGKTDLALYFAKKFNGELVSCDSRQVYKGLDIGTGKMPDEKVNIKKGQKYWEMDGIKVWMYDVSDFKKQYTVYDYVKDAGRIINQIIKRGKLPIIIGGTGLYLRALLEGLSYLSVPPDFKLRQDLEKLSLAQLQKKLQKTSIAKWENMNYSDRQNPRRIIRALEIVSVSSTTHVPNEGNEESLRVSWESFRLPSFGPIRGDFEQKFEILKIGLTAPREILYRRIDRRVIKRVKQGMIKEAEDLGKLGLSFRRMKQLGLEYGVLADYLAGKIKDRDEFIFQRKIVPRFIKILQDKIHGFARRQLTWYKKEKNVNWFDISKGDFVRQVERQVDSWYYS